MVNRVASTDRNNKSLHETVVDVLVEQLARSFLVALLWIFADTG